MMTSRWLRHSGRKFLRHASDLRQSPFVRLAMSMDLWGHVLQRVRSVEEEDALRKEPGVHQVDGGFFEKFGSLLKHPEDRSKGLPAIVRQDVIRRKRSCKLTAFRDDGVAVSSEEDALDEDALDEEDDEGVGTATPTTSDSEPEETENKKQLISNVIGWNLEELYSEVLYEIIHMIGDGNEEEREDLFSYLREAFKFEDLTHNELLENAKAKEAPDIVLNVEVIEAKDLHPKDANGFSDPYCTLYLNSAAEHRYNTSVKSETLTPAWEEHFSLPLGKCLDDKLIAEVWDFDPAESVAEKMKKIGGVKGVKGLRKLMKEIAVTASTGKHDDELIGSYQIPLKSIPVTGQTIWCPLEKKGKAKSQGMLKLKISVGAVKNLQVAMQEHRSLLKVLLLYELENRKIGHYSWKGDFSSKGEILLNQHLAQAGINVYHQLLAQWIEYVNVHVEHPIHFVVFSRLMESLIVPLQSATPFSDEEKKSFWEALKKLLPSCFNCLKKIRRLSAEEKGSHIQLSGLLSIFATLKKLSCPNGIELFSTSTFSWFKTIENGCDIQGSIRDAVIQSANEWVNVVLEKNKMDESSDETKLQHVIKVAQLLRGDLQQALDFHEKYFQDILQFPFVKTLYKIYDSELSEIANPIVDDVSWKLKPLRFSDNLEDAMQENENMQMGTSLFELYLVLQRFAIMAQNIRTLDLGELKMQKYYTWFRKGVAHWLEIALFKALQRIEKAVEIDALEPVDSSVRYSSSAVDTLTIYYQVRTFWSQLAWPDVEGSYSFIAIIIQDICRCSVFYADKMEKKVEGMGETEDAFEKKFEVTNEWCLAINNIGYVQESLAPFVQDLDTEEVLNKLADYRSELEAHRCRETLKLVIANAEETVGNKIADIIQKVADKMSPAMQRFLQEGAELLNQESNVMDRLMSYLDNNLMTLHSSLSAENFDRTLEIIWANLETILLSLIESGVEKRRPPSFFSNLHETLKMLLSFFQREEQCCQKMQQMIGVEPVEEENGRRCESKKKILRMESLLSLHGMETYDLIHQYHLERLGEQLQLEAGGQSSSHGLLTVRLQFVEDILRIEIMNARNLRSMDSNGSCDPYVKVHLLPEEKFSGITKPRTKTHKKNLFPLFDETFTITLKPEHKEINNALLYFVVKDYDMIGANEFLAEAYVPFSRIPTTEMTVGLEALPQIHLPLSRPGNSDSKVLSALERRQGDKLAREFCKSKKALFSH